MHIGVETKEYQLLGSPTKSTIRSRIHSSIMFLFSHLSYVCFYSPGTDAAAGASAAFSACSALYAGQTFNSSLSSPASLKNTSYASTLLAHSEALYSFAVNASGGQQVYQDAVPQVADAYGSSTFGDELTIAALFLAMAANSTNYFNQAKSYYTQNNLAGQDDIFNWDSKTPGIYVLFAEIASSRAKFGGNLTSWQNEAERYFDNIINGKSQASMTSGKLALL